MGGKSITLLFIKDKKLQPGAIICDATSGEYHSQYFFDWRDAIHFIGFFNKDRTIENNRTPNFDEKFELWSMKYGYDEDEKFNGNLNEFMCNDIDYFTTIGIIEQNTDLNIISAWKYHQPKKYHMN